MNVSSAKRNIPKDIKSLNSKFFFISITSILCRIEVNHPVSRLPVVGATNNIISQHKPEHKFEKMLRIFLTDDALSSKVPQLTLRIAMQTRKTLRVFLVSDLFSNENLQLRCRLSVTIKSLNSNI